MHVGFCCSSLKRVEYLVAKVGYFANHLNMLEFYSEAIIEQLLLYEEFSLLRGSDYSGVSTEYPIYSRKFLYSDYLELGFPVLNERWELFSLHLSLIAIS